METKRKKYDWKLKDKHENVGSPANSLPHSRLCPVIQPQRIIQPHTWFNKHGNIPYSVYTSTIIPMSKQTTVASLNDYKLTASLLDLVLWNVLKVDLAHSGALMPITAVFPPVHYTPGGPPHLACPPNPSLVSCHNLLTGEVYTTSMLLEILLSMVKESSFWCSNIYETIWHLLSIGR